MRNMSVGNETNVLNRDVELDIINEYISERSDPLVGSVPRALPGPPPLSRELEQDFQFLPTVFTSRTPRPSSTPQLVARGSSTQASILQQAGVPMASPNLSSPTAQQSRSRVTDRGRLGASRGKGSRTVMRGRQDPGTEQLESLLDKPELVITEQPKQRGMRFRYECEGRSAGSILGASTTEQNKTLPAIELRGNVQQVKKMKVTVSLVTKDIPYRPHPHGLVGKDCVDGVCVVTINPRTSRKHSFSNLGIQCVRRKEIDPALEKRRSQGIDPFHSGHSKSIEDIEMNVVRLCFQCEVEKPDGEKYSLSPVVSEPIYDKKATTTSELKISRLNVVRGPCTGKTEIYLLCDKVQKDDIEIIFTHGEWMGKAEFAQTDVHRQIAVVFKSPPFRDLDIQEEVDVQVQLRRLSDHMESEPVTFTYLPHNPDPYEVNRKRKIAKDVFGDGNRVAALSPALPEASSSRSHGFKQFPFGTPDIPLQMSCLEERTVPHAHFVEEMQHNLSCGYETETSFCAENDGSSYNDYKIAGENLNSDDISKVFTAVSKILENQGFYSSGQQQNSTTDPTFNTGTDFAQVRPEEGQNSSYSLTDMDQNFNMSTLDIEFPCSYSEMLQPYNYNLTNGNPSCLEPIQLQDPSQTSCVADMECRFQHSDNESQKMPRVKNESNE
ncbi:transcription factor RelB isoform X2 [Lepisosteus oculatus]|uniref:transcription factor RelB isoform X2 n=1 Tax=Lepisosteus oculatus TaxID=7918 RepID=UPI003719E557